jgi:phospholipid/cholesterol/gamma-HCH transport system substrate-binding protein
VSRTDHWKLGLFVTLGMALSVALLFWLGLSRFRRESIPIVTFFDESVQGLEVGSPVKFRGVTLGTVANITIAPDGRHVRVDTQIFTQELKRLGLSVDSTMAPEVRVQLASAGITGVKFLQVDFFEPARYPTLPLPFPTDGILISSVPSTLKGLEAALNEFLDQLPAYGKNIQLVLEEARGALAQLKAVAGTMQDEKGPVQTLVRRVDTAVSTIEGAVREAQLNQTAAAIRATAGSVSQASNTLGHTAGQYSGMSDQIEASLKGLRETLESVRALTTDLNRDPSALLRGKRADPGVEKPR